MKKFIIALAIIFITQCNFIHSKKTNPLETQQSESLKQFHDKFMQWKQTLSPEQTDLFHELFEPYQQAYQQRKDPKNIALVQELEKSLQHIMDNWQSFYKEHSNAVTFHQKVQDWQNTLSFKKQRLLDPLFEAYENTFQKYDQNPSNALNKKQMQQLMARIQGHIAT